MQQYERRNYKISGKKGQFRKYTNSLAIEYTSIEEVRIARG